MANEVTVKQSPASTPVKVVPASALAQPLDQARERIARRAYERFESRGRAHGRDLDDWLQAEAEILHSIPHSVAETAASFIVFAQLPGSWTAADLVVGIDPRRLIVLGQRRVAVTFSDASGERTESRVQPILRVLELPVDVDPARTTAALAGNTLEIVMPKTRP